jgi:hypothetical protein
MIEKGDIDKEQPSLNDEAAISLSRELAGTLGQEIPIKKLPRQMEEWEAGILYLLWLYQLI